MASLQEQSTPTKVGGGRGGTLVRTFYFMWRSLFIAAKEWSRYLCLSQIIGGLASTVHTNPDFGTAQTMCFGPEVTNTGLVQGWLVTLKSDSCI